MAITGPITPAVWYLVEARSLDQWYSDGLNRFDFHQPGVSIKGYTLTLRRNTLLRKTVFAFPLLFLPGGTFACGDSASVQAQKAEARDEFLQLLRTELGALRPKWSEVTVTEAFERHYSVRITYRTAPSGSREVEFDTKAVARACLKLLKSQGRTPKEERILVSVYAEKPEVGETGSRLFRNYGSTYYSWNDDQLHYELPRK